MYSEKRKTHLVDENLSFDVFQNKLNNLSPGGCASDEKI
jgi:hypothetical protein